MQKNPYVHLGIPFGASRDQAQAAFAKRARRLRRRPEGAQLLTDLTWALNQVDDVLRDPDLAVGLYRVPADPTALVPDANGLLNPVPERMEPTYVLDRAAQSAAHRTVYVEALAVLVDEVGDSIALPAR